MLKVIGRYNERKYEIEVGGEVVYTAGNSPYDSQVYTERGVGLDTMRRYCEQTAKDIAKERKAKFLGCEYMEADNG